MQSRGTEAISFFNGDGLGFFICSNNAHRVIPFDVEDDVDRAKHSHEPVSQHRSG